VSIERRERLLEVLRALPGTVVAFSGGVDSAVVAKAAFLALGDRAIAMTSDSPSVPRSELASARELAAIIGIQHVVLPTTEFDNPDYQKNGGDRCYFCKSELYTRIESQLDSLGLDTVCSGANLDDLGDYRPGLTAAAEHHVRHPLQEAGFTKANVRELAQHWGLPVWDKPASPCLSSRLAPGLEVTPERTLRVELGEAYLKTLGIRDGRVRYHEGDLARVEIPSDDIARLLDPEVRQALSNALHDIGFRFVSVDLDGFRSGSLNQLVSLELKSRYSSVRTPLNSPT
jgi:pyridinium-3,5-biscarboxylic acid mononucleotide sulfurtransferase